MTKSEQFLSSGILEKEQEQSVVYGSTDFGKTCANNESYKEILEKVSTSLKIKPHSVRTEKQQVIELFTAVECKGIVGNDGRHYLLDLLRMTPPDLNYLQGSTVRFSLLCKTSISIGISVPVEHLSDAMKRLNYPKPSNHRLSCLRQELIDAFVE